jgi:hypothetical protein
MAPEWIDHTKAWNKPSRQYGLCLTNAGHDHRNARFAMARGRSIKAEVPDVVVRMDVHLDLSSGSRSANDDPTNDVRRSAVVVQSDYDGPRVCFCNAQI